MNKKRAKSVAARIDEYLTKIQNDKEIKVIVSLEKSEFESFSRKLLSESKQLTVGQHTAYKHQPHFQGGEYHGHCDLPGGCQVSWTISGQRLHPSKFPADDKVPKNAKIAVAKVLGISDTKLESFTIHDPSGEMMFLLEIQDESRANRLFKRLSGAVGGSDEK